MVFRRKKPKVEIVEDDIRAKVEADAPVQAPAPVTPVANETEGVEEQQGQLFPVFLTQADVNKLIYENNLMLQEILRIAKEE